MTGPIPREAADTRRPKHNELRPDSTPPPLPDPERGCGQVPNNRTLTIIRGVAFQRTLQPYNACMTSCFESTTSAVGLINHIAIAPIHDAMEIVRNI